MRVLPYGGMYNRGTKKVFLWIYEEEAQEIIRELAKEVDIIIENFKPGTSRSGDLVTRI